MGDLYLLAHLLELAHATGHQRIDMLQISLNTGETRSKLGIFHDCFWNLHVLDFRLAAIVKRYQVIRCWHLAQLTGQRTQYRRSSLCSSKLSKLTAKRRGSSEEIKRARERRTGILFCDSAYCFNV